MLAELAESDPNRYLGANMIAGDYTGTFEWWFTSIGTGTELKCRWRARPNSWFGALGLAFPSGLVHSFVIRQGFRLLNRKFESERGTTET